ncbi:hypothetical protein BP5796_11249 [Coleophoma crateriformis]|uniref:EGF-like domain-containing protein n=1 Tax=Coleophoma crateriformis TaxID=565419 RepID=A0A3D8QHZ3_9HELO|nr:hypothetical protein BP5796_11249 [Coleophoma crateriformis]
MEAGLPPEMPPPVQKPFENPRKTPSPNQGRPRPPLPQALQGQGPIGVAISRPTQVPQWPLQGALDSPENERSQYQPPAGRGPAPQRPPRPSRVPSILDASRLQEHTPAFQYKPQQSLSPPGQRDKYDDDEELTSPGSRSAMTSASSRPSTVSSVGTIPDFPIPNIPVMPTPPRRSANLGPPPSSRRGASSYYSQISYVSPIPEENTPTRSHGSYASSAAIPSSWGSDSNYDALDSPTVDMRDDAIEEGRESRGSNDDNDERGLVRKASVGKRVQPSIITTSSSEKGPQRQEAANIGKPGSKLERMGVLPLASPNPKGGTEAGLEAPRATARPETTWPNSEDMRSPVNGRLAGGTGLIDSSSEETIPTLATAVTTDNRVPAQIFNSEDPKAQEMLAAYNGASSLPAGGVAPTRTPSQRFSRLSAIRRPPRLDIDAVRTAEARGSLTSLPDLIRRATRLAAMMDRGRRPASRINDLNDFPFAGDEKSSGEERSSPPGDEKYRSGLSGMLAAFPPPGVATPRETSPRPVSPWPSPYAAESLGDIKNGGQPKRSRKCCGLPCWGFILIILIIIIIIAAAIVVPLELLVFNKTKSNTAKSTSSTSLSSCMTQLQCQNGGINTISSGICSCLCTNGFTGTTCTVGGTPGCSTTSISGSSSNVTIGDAISRLLDGAQTNFSIPLSSTIIVARFNTASLSCTSENALVTFDGQNTRQGSAADVVVATASLNSKLVDTTSTANAIQSDPSGKTITITFGSAIDGLTTLPTAGTASTTLATAGTSTTSLETIPTAGTSTTSLETISTARSSSTSLTTASSSSKTTSSATTSKTSTSASATASSTAGFVVTQQVLDFSRVAVLYVLQQESVDNAISAQSALQSFLSLTSPSIAAAANLSIGNSNTINLNNFKIDVGNGTVGSNNVASRRRRWDGRGLSW